jgi:DNA-binding CsgD family transcriptional regulator
VLAAAGHSQPLPKSRRPQHPGGLTGREAEVLRLAARSLTTREIADRLYISAKTADHHIQNVYTKIGVSTRAAAALWRCSTPSPAEPSPTETETRDWPGIRTG